MHLSRQKLQLAAVVLVAICPLIATADDDLLCKVETCNGNDMDGDALPPYTESNTTLCDWIPATQWPKPTKCNCGAQCVKNLPMDQNCAQTMNSFPEILSVCGPGLICTRDSDDRNKRTCRPYSGKPCVNEVVAYAEDQESGVLGPGRYLPICDDLGDYASSQCSAASTCYCVDKEGTKIFGEGPITERSQMNCLCSEFHNSNPSAGFRCLANGNFDELQCIDKQYCFCFDPVKGDITEGPWGFNMMPMLSCYNEEIHGLNYSQPCAEALAEVENSMDGDDDLIIIGQSNVPQCEPDGYYSPVQFEGTTAFCANRMGNMIENFHTSLDVAFGMKCSCARRRSLMEEVGMGSSKPKCHRNGDFCRIQKRGLLAYCVDGNGNQVGITLSVDDTASLNCEEQLNDAQKVGTMDCS